MSLDSTSASIAVNATKQLTATVQPDNATNQSINWSSDHADIAAVSNTGLVTGKKAGSATITATSADNSKATATCAITVTAAQGA